MRLLPPKPHAKVSKADGALDQKALKPLGDMVLVELRRVQNIGLGVPLMEAINRSTLTRGAFETGRKYRNKEEASFLVRGGTFTMRGNEEGRILTSCKINTIVINVVSL